MKGKFFLDTNIIIYSFDNTELKKKKNAQALINEAIESNNGMVSFQVVQEFLNVATRKFKIPLKIMDAKTFLEQILIPLCEIYPSSDLYYFALDIQENTGYAFYDSLIIASAVKAGCSILYSEDLHDGHRFGGLTIKNPF